MNLPDDFAARTVAVHGEVGARWLSRLPELLREISGRWSLEVGPPLPNLTYNYVAPATHADGTRAILKLGVPNHELTTEIAALRLYDGRGAVQLLEADANLGALVLERIEPGTPLTTLVETGDERATSIAVTVMRRLWMPAPVEHPFPSVADWAMGLTRLRQRFDGSTGPLPDALVDEAERLFAELLATSEEQVVLHGDLHHDNILEAQREPWLAIDPKGLVGDPGYEIGSLLCNPVPGLLALPNPRRIIARRLDQIAEELRYDRERLRNWALAQAVLSAWWDVDDNQDSWRYWIACAELIARIEGTGIRD